MPHIEQKEKRNEEYIHKKLQKAEVKKSLINGDGLFTTDYIRKNSFVCFYTGELINNREADKRETEYKRNGNENFYLFRYDNKVVIGATLKGGSARYVNHSCDPNVSAYGEVINGKKSILYYADKCIAKGAELTLDYMSTGKEAEKQVCNCKSQNCKGFF